ncbi:hypothetical protein QFC19_001947 [Naganishia cerealis]|uniref:Uncharacterized protein n=1 Tax=Naganishia cerealis TaxID=610337 RepID=A0ACC2WDI3_9TREE|nr:hypothetical protein QFC19_001947 [Naganishia cerealis]
MARTTSKSTSKGGGATKASKHTSASTAQKRKTVPIAKSAKARIKAPKAKISKSDKSEQEEEMETAEEIEGASEEEDDMAEQSQEALEQVEPNFLETQQKDEMAELKARLEAKRMQKLKKTMNARVAQFDVIFTEAMEEVKQQANNSSAAKELQVMVQSCEGVTLAFISQNMQLQETSQEEDPEEVVDGLRMASKEVGSVCRRFAVKDLAMFKDTLAGTDETSESIQLTSPTTASDGQHLDPSVAARPKILALSARNVRNQVTEEFSAIAEKTKVWAISNRRVLSARN